MTTPLPVFDTGPIETAATPRWSLTPSVTLSSPTPKAAPASPAPAHGLSRSQRGLPCESRLDHRRHRLHRQDRDRLLRQPRSRPPLQPRSGLRHQRPHRTDTRHPQRPRHADRLAHRCRRSTGHPRHGPAHGPHPGPLRHRRTSTPPGRLAGQTPHHQPDTRPRPQPAQCCSPVRGTPQERPPSPARFRTADCRRRHDHHHHTGDSTRPERRRRPRGHPRDRHRHGHAPQERAATGALRPRTAHRDRRPRPVPRPRGLWPRRPRRGRRPRQRHPGRPAFQNAPDRPETAITVADLTGVGALDAALASAILHHLLR